MSASPYPPSSHWIFPRLPRILPASWRLHRTTVDGAHYVQAFTGLSIIVSGATELDGKRWVHLSVAHPSRLPTWAELVDAKEFLVGKDEYAVQVLPPRAEHVNIHPYCLHLFHCVEGNQLPDFTRGGKTL